MGGMSTSYANTRGIPTLLKTTRGDRFASKARADISAELPINRRGPRKDAKRNSKHAERQRCGQHCSL